MQQTCTLSTQHKSSWLSHFNDGVGSLGCMNLTFTSKFSVETSIIIPTQYCLSYKHTTNWEGESVSPGPSKWTILKTNWTAWYWSSETYFAPIIESDIGMNWWKDLVPGTVSVLLYLSSIFTLMLLISGFFKKKNQFLLFPLHKKSSIHTLFRSRYYENINSKIHFHQKNNALWKELL